jgi:hypothetical protein
VARGALRALCRTIRALMTAPRVRAEMSRLAWMLARCPRPKREVWPDLMRPAREMPPPARWAAANAWAMNGRARCEPDERTRPGRMRNSRSSAIGVPGNVPITTKIQTVRWVWHLADTRRNVREGRKNLEKTINRPRRNVRPFILPSFGRGDSLPRSPAIVRGDAMGGCSDHRRPSPAARATNSPCGCG